MPATSRKSIPESDEESGFSGELESEDDFIDDSDDEKVYPSGPAKRKQSAHGGFILDEAEVDDDYEESDEAEEGFDEIMKQQERNRAVEREYINKRRSKIFHLEDHDELEELVAKYENRAIDEADEYVRTDEQSKNQLLPTVHNPYLWLVKCQIGEEKRLAFLLMRRALKCVEENKPLGIKSVIQLDRLKGFLYVEAYKSIHVRQAITNIYGFRLGANNLRMVPINEMVDVLRVVNLKFDLPPNSWVRFKKGLYKGDIAQVQSCDPIKAYATVRFVPRINYAMLGENVKTASLRYRPVQMLFDTDKATAAGISCDMEGQYIVFKGRKFLNGFQVKRVPITSLEISNITPLLKELEMFNMTLNLDEVNIASDVSSYLSVGDPVRVISGELIGTIGIIKSISNEIVTIQPQTLEINDLLQFTCHDLEKYFRIGDHVKVLRGQYKDESGIIVKVDGPQLILLTDITISHIKLLSRDVQLCNEKSIAYDESGRFTVHDFVQLDPQTVGVVVGIENALVSVLNQYDSVQKLGPQGLGKRRSTDGMFYDRNRNKVFLGDTLTVCDGKYKGVRGQFKHYFRGFVFLFSKYITSNAQMLVTRDKNLTLDSSTQKIPDVPFAVPSSSSHSNKFSNQSRNQKQDQKRDKSLVAATVYITKGPYKSHIGIVKDMTDSIVRVELHAKNKIINVVRDNIRVIDGTNFGTVRPTAMFTDSNPEKSPHVSQTPYQDIPKTPKYGSMTPGQDGSITPAQTDSVWEVPSTPRFTADIDASLTEEILSSVAIMSEFNNTVGSINKFTSITPSPISPSFPMSSSSVTPSPVDTSSLGTVDISDLTTDYYQPAEELKKRFISDIGTVVKILSSFQPPSLAGKVGVVTGSAPASDMVTIKILDDNLNVASDSITLNVSKRYLALREPKINERVKVVLEDKVLHGTLLQRDLADGIVELDEVPNPTFKDRIGMFLFNKLISYVSC